MEFHTRKQLRLQGYDYSKNGVYFITINVKSSPEFLSNITGGISILLRFGEIIKTTWEEIPAHHPGTYLDEYIIMPDHFHGVIFLMNQGSLEKAATLSDIIKGFKRVATKRIRFINKSKQFIWQKSFIDKIILTDSELTKIRSYIISKSPTV